MAVWATGQNVQSLLRLALVKHKLEQRQSLRPVELAGIFHDSLVQCGDRLIIASGHSHQIGQFDQTFGGDEFKIAHFKQRGDLRVDVPGLVIGIDQGFQPLLCGVDRDHALHGPQIHPEASVRSIKLRQVGEDSRALAAGGLKTLNQGNGPFDIAVLNIDLH